MGIEDFLILYPEPDSVGVNNELLSKKELYDLRIPAKGEEDEERKIFRYQELNARLSSQLANFDKRHT